MSIPPTIHSLRPPVVVLRMAIRILHEASADLRRTTHRMQTLEARMEARARMFKGQP